jgi:hypothetical protein
LSGSGTYTVLDMRARIYCTNTAKNMKAAIYNDATGALVASSQQQSVGTGTNWITFTFASAPTLTGGNTYVLVVWSASGSGEAYLLSDSLSGGYGRYDSETYDGWPDPASFTSLNREYSIYARLSSTREPKVKAAIYLGSDHSFIAGTEEVTVTADGWVTFNFASPKPSITSGTNYVLVVWSDAGQGDVELAYDDGDYSTQGHRDDDRTYDGWPTTLDVVDSGYGDDDEHQDRKYSIYCTYSIP